MHSGQATKGASRSSTRRFFPAHSEAACSLDSSSFALPLCSQAVELERSTDGDGKLERYSLFSDPLASYYWSYDNTGLKLAQLRFYEISTTVAAP
jgi:hypothetical protein